LENRSDINLEPNRRVKDDLVSFMRALVSRDSSGYLWLVGAGSLISVVPITLLFIKPINDVLLNPGNNPESEETKQAV
jgi:hypothetical protein